MQVYRLLDIASNKVTTEEAQGIPHHLIRYKWDLQIASVIDPHEQFTVRDFRDRATPLVTNRPATF